MIDYKLGILGTLYDESMGLYGNQLYFDQLMAILMQFLKTQDPSSHQVLLGLLNRPFLIYQSTDGTKRYVTSPKIVPFDCTLTVSDGRKRYNRFFNCLFILIVTAYSVH